MLSPYPSSNSSISYKPNTDLGYPTDTQLSEKGTSAGREHFSELSCPSLNCIKIPQGMA